MKWIMGATYINILDTTHFPELQIWRPAGSTTHQKLNGTITAAVEEVRSGVYEFVVDPPLLFQPEDILGVFQPSQLDNSILSIDYALEGIRSSVNYYLILILDNNQVEPLHTFIDLNNGSKQNRSATPLVSLEIGELVLLQTLKKGTHVLNFTLTFPQS